MNGHALKNGVNGITLPSAQVGNDLLIHGAAARSSDETPAMGVERRGIVSAERM